MVQGNLRAMGYQVARERVRQAVRATDPLNTALWWRSLAPRQPYSVPSPIPCGTLVSLVLFTIIIIMLFMHVCDAGKLYYVAYSVRVRTKKCLKVQSFYTFFATWRQISL